MSFLFRFAGDDRRPQKIHTKKPAPIKVIVPPQIVEVPVLSHKTELMPVPMPASLWKIMREVCDVHKCLPSELAGQRRSGKLTNARRHYIVRARQETSHSLSLIGKSIKKDHTSVLYHWDLYQNGATIDPFKPVRQPPKSHKISKDHPDYNKLSPRQEIVYALMQQGLGNKDIAEYMGRTYRQAKSDVYEVRLKLKRQELANAQQP